MSESKSVPSSVGRNEIAEWLRTAAAKVTIHGLEPMEAMKDKLLLAAHMLKSAAIPAATGDNEIPLCAGHAESWFCGRDHLVGGMDATCVVCANTFPSATERDEFDLEGKLLEVLRLADEVTDAFDREAEDIGGSRNPMLILQELGPAVDEANEAIEKKSRQAVDMGKANG